MSVAAVSVTAPVPDVIGPDWVSRTIELPPDSEGEVVATLVSRASGPRHDRSVLYLHGYSDYFFEGRIGQPWLEHGYDFYALDLRKHGRSIRPHQTPNYTDDLRVYGAEIAAALGVIRAEHPAPGARVVLLAQSTGGLIASLWANAHPGAIDALVLSSPWFDYNGPRVMAFALTATAEAVGALAPGLPLAALEPHYHRQLHVNGGGEHIFDLDWKPYAGFPARAGWARTIRRGQARVRRGLDIACPVLVCASTRSGNPKKPDPEGRDCDLVLNVEHMARYGPGLGADVTVVRIEGGIHDLALSAPPARERFERAVFDWLEAKAPS